MTLTMDQFADALELTILCSRHPASCGRPARYSVRIQYAEVKDGPGLRSEVGFGETAWLAGERYREAISGRVLRMHTTGQNLREISVPELAPSPMR